MSNPLLDTPQATTESSYTSPLSRRQEPATCLTCGKYTIKSGDGAEICLWRISTSAPNSSSTLQPAIVYVHGGAFIYRTVHMETVDLDRFNDALTRRLGTDPLHDLGCVLLYISYRIAGEAPFPAPAEDVYAAYEFARANADDLGILKNQICIAGVSAGGNLAWAATQMVVDKSLPPPCSLMLIYPMLDPDTDWPEHKGETRQAEKAVLSLGWATYLGDRGMLDSGQRKYAKLLDLSPGDLGKLPPVYIDVGGHDYFHAEVERAIYKLEACTDVTARVWEGLSHNFESALYKDKHTRADLQKTWEFRREFLQRFWCPLFVHT